MQSQKMSISLPKSLYDFVSCYQKEHSIKSRSEVVTKALYMLQQAQLGADYHAANAELDDTFDGTVDDGLDTHETW